MFTIKRLQIPPLPDDWKSAKDSFVNTITNFFNLLNQPGSLDIDNANIRAATGVKFPAAWGAKSADANTLDDYQIGTYNPIITAGSGTGLVIGSSTGRYRKIGSLVLVTVDFTITTNGTSSSYLAATLPNGWLPDTNYIGGGLLVTTGAALFVDANSSLGALYCTQINAGYPGADGNRIIMTATYGC